MDYKDFLNTTKVLRMLYGLHVATIFFEKNIDKYYNLNKDDLQKSPYSIKVRYNKQDNRKDIH